MQQMVLMRPGCCCGGRWIEIRVCPALPASCLPQASPKQNLCSLLMHDIRVSHTWLSGIVSVQQMPTALGLADGLLGLRMPLMLFVLPPTCRRRPTCRWPFAALR